MSSRTKSRKRAVDAVFAADLRKVSPSILLEEAFKQVAGQQNQDEIFGYARSIVDGIIEHNGDIDDLLDTYSNAWPLDRMPAVDRAILRVAVWEICYNTEIPAPVAIDEAIELARELSTDESPKFINGLLSKIASTREAK